MSRWFRFYEEALNNPKVQRLSGDLFKAWVNLLCLASKSDGKIKSLADAAFALRLSEPKAGAIVAALARHGLLDRVEGGYFAPHDWGTRQYIADSSKERVRRYRERRRENGLPQVSDYTEHRTALLARDGEKCVYCEISESLVVDHMTPISAGGTDALDNLALACKRCNSGKAGRTPEGAGLIIRVTSARNALARYRDTKRPVTVTVTPPEQIQNRSEIDDGGERADSSFALATELAAICGHKTPEDWPPGWCGSPHWVQKCLNEGWLPEVMRAETLATTKRKRDGPIDNFLYLEKPLARAHARHAAPLPKVEIEQETIHATHRTAPTGSRLGNLGRQLREEPSAFGGEAAGGVSYRLFSQR